MGKFADPSPGAAGRRRTVEGPKPVETSQLATILPRSQIFLILSCLCHDPAFVSSAEIGFPLSLPAEFAAAG